MCLQRLFFFVPLFDLVGIWGSLFMAGISECFVADGRVNESSWFEFCISKTTYVLLIVKFYVLNGYILGIKTFCCLFTKTFFKYFL
ncbi:unnamed protein product [Ixodes persulcatus]